jgi:ectoine hydroxylase-related dioxygenase (phytanoyl-CoA dioxygenase family)
MPLTQVQFWVALDDVDLDNGCMQFVPAHHHDGTAAHVVASGDPDDSGRLLAYADVSEASPELAVACPLAAGGATIHTALTPHATGPNTTTDRARRAYIFNLTASDAPDDRLQDHLRADYVRNPGKVRVP